MPLSQCTVDLERLQAEATALAAQYRDARPFPHIVLDGIVDVRPEDLEHFPPPEWDGWEPLGTSYEFKKFVCNDISRIPQPFAGLMDELSRPRFLRVLEQITGIPALVPDPYLTGGGLHLSGPGGVLTPHTDFHIYSQLNLYRRVNVLVYLNDGWQEEFGGCLELQGATGEKKTVVPQLGRCVIFTTDDRSVHGFPNPIVEGRWRRSIALYYYTSQEAPGFSGDATTYWREHGAQSGARKTRVAAYRGLLQVSRAFSLLAHLINPNQGMSWWKVRQERLNRAADGGGGTKA
jgi:hypothetical protein